MSPKTRVPPRKKGLEDIKKETRETSSLHFVSCLEAQKHIEKTIKEVIDLQKNIIQENTKIENDVLPKIQNVITLNNRKLEELERTKIKLEDQLQEVKANERKLDDVKENLDSCTANTFTEIAALLDKAEETNIAIGYWIETFKELISEEEKALPTTEKAIERTREKMNVIYEVLSSGEERDGEIDIYPRMAAMAFQEEDYLPTQTQITAEILRKMNTQVKRLVEQGRLYGIQHRNGRRRFARISYPENEKLCIHHLREEPPPPNALVVDHGEVMRLVDPSTRLTFMDLGVGRSTLGRMYVRLHEDNKRAKQFSFLCTGEIGPSYVNTNILEMKCDSDGALFVRGGDYETNDGEGGKALVPGVMEDVDIWMYTSLPMGSVTAGSESDTTFAQFKIYTRDDVDYQSTSFGMVEEGLSVLTEAISHYPNIRELYIKDCGIVLPLTIPVTRPVQ